MGFLKTLFGPSKDEIWGKIAADIGGDYQEGGFFGKDVLRYQHGEWEMLLDTYTVSSGTGNNRSSQTYTRMRAPFVNKDGLYFKIYREGLFSGLGKFFGMQDIEIGDSYFDDSFVIKGNDAKQIRLLLADERIKERIDAQPYIHFEIRDDEGWFGAHFPEGVDELYFQCAGVLRNKEQLKQLFELFALVLHRLVAIDSAYEDDPQVELK